MLERTSKRFKQKNINRREFEKVSLLGILGLVGILVGSQFQKLKQTLQSAQAFIEQQEGFKPLENFSYLQDKHLPTRYLPESVAGVFPNSPFAYTRSEAETNRIINEALLMGANNIRIFVGREKDTSKQIHNFADKVMDIGENKIGLIVCLMDGFSLFHSQDDSSDYCTPGMQERQEKKYDQESIEKKREALSQQQRDFYENENKLEETLAYLSATVELLKDIPNITMWEVMNEADLPNEDIPTAQRLITHFYKRTIPTIRLADEEHPLRVIGTGLKKPWLINETELLNVDANIANSFHSYVEKDRTFMDTLLTHINWASCLPIYCGEMGYSDTRRQFSDPCRGGGIVIDLNDDVGVTRFFHYVVSNCNEGESLRLPTVGFWQNDYDDNFRLELTSDSTLVQNTQNFSVVVNSVYKKHSS